MTLTESDLLALVGGLALLLGFGLAWWLRGVACRRVQTTAPTP